MKRILTAIFGVLVILALASSLEAQTPGQTTAELTALLNEFLAGVSRGDVSVHERFWADDLIYTSAAGRRIGKADILKDSRPAAGEKEKPATPTAAATTYTAEDIRVHEYGDTAVLAFRLVGTTKKPAGVETTRYLNTGTFVRRGGQWRAVGWQATRQMEADADAKARGEAARNDLLRRDGEWAASAGTTDVEKIVSYWSDDAVVTPPHEAPVAGKPAIRKFVDESLKVPGFTVRWKPAEAVVSTSGDLGYTTGENVFTFADATGNVAPHPGRYVTVWKKDDAGQWRCVVDFWNEAPERASMPAK
jgi:ketosteroid isomerase-like protein